MLLKTAHNIGIIFEQRITLEDQGHQRFTFPAINWVVSGITWVFPLPFYDITINMSDSMMFPITINMSDSMMFPITINMSDTMFPININMRDTMQFTYH